MNSAEAQQLQRQWAVHLRRPVTFNNSAGLELALIPPGEFRDVDGQTTTVAAPYYLSAAEVTLRQFRQFVESKNFVTEAESNGQGGFLIDGRSAPKQSPAYRWSAPGYAAESEDAPVVHVTWNDALAFCLWLSERERATCRLPTAAEWAWAARGGAEGLDYIGSAEQLGQEAWVAANAEGHPHAVRTRRANPWGLYDVHGNVGEWCQDDFDAQRLERMLGKPAPAAGLLRIAAGSSYVSRIANYRLHATRMPPSSATSTVGFRVLCEVQPASPLQP